MAEFSKDQLTLALAHHVGQKLIGADRVLEESELAALHRAFPKERMVEAGFVEPGTGSFTDRFEEAARTAFRELRGQLTEDEKMDLMRVWWSLSEADGEIAAVESDVMLKAGQVLGWDLDRIQSAFETLAGVE